MTYELSITRSSRDEGNRAGFTATCIDVEDGGTEIFTVTAQSSGIKEIFFKNNIKYPDMDALIVVMEILRDAEKKHCKLSDEDAAREETAKAVKALTDSFVEGL